jgi:hypothetical protein
LKVAFGEQWEEHKLWNGFSRPRYVVISVEDASYSGHPLNIKTHETID